MYNSEWNEIEWNEEMESTKMYIDKKIKTNWYSPTWE